jgi:alkanesulfonate monooxygenase SsuD/methylene tetrahydromethanopterin reductase-like flavin-dependent oxidoreductase (luciferase family)
LIFSTLFSHKLLGVGLGAAHSTDFAKFGEVTDSQARAQRLNEALAVLVGLWSGEPFSFQGQHFQVQEVTLLPKPVQTPRIPIWVGGGYPLKGPLQRAARWDGSLLYNQTSGEPWLDMTPANVRTLKSYVAGQRDTATGYEIVIGSNKTI